MVAYYRTLALMNGHLLEEVELSLFDYPVYGNKYGFKGNMKASKVQIINFM